ncbi:hypothetical protein [Pseudoponticoccus marisrubri]|uniref:Antitoxin n=1 Tax=Pseudoponticoccus marisrubri TaxID=1685382 RepID=A0A0W7WF15_9RHOB|nr:hypothetical protein [Pseudoponticoccus marisrubri]KUF09161.1 hypothetical protein AVJ23_18980 [Pseudoponticoccus marisrubri]
MTDLSKAAFRAPEIPAGRLRDELSLYLRKLEMQGQRYLITRHGRVVAGLVPPWELHALEEVVHRSAAERRRRLEASDRHMTWLEQAREKARRGEDVSWDPSQDLFRG